MVNPIKLLQSLLYPNLRVDEQSAIAVINLLVHMRLGQQLN
jgi:hypothetical protein